MNNQHAIPACNKTPVSDTPFETIRAFVASSLEKELKAGFISFNHVCRNHSDCSIDDEFAEEDIEVNVRDEVDKILVCENIEELVKTFSIMNEYTIFSYPFMDALAFNLSQGKIFTTMSAPTMENLQ